ncbi:Holliday junction branch migration protein RuvA [Leadbettera azotonutricia]|uniref:Holliday junction branch migration complex subunit RuvA n=1 Tax=Leadbettera azotonutricia (strain ATCC BAA-888 / DSM 13862 / ZAS-9) TaxID=545695 RepID=F5YC95_LEAAZ|nr:Holliday junction branch migration protein RuvA [Leadbettera azotonutricia]AEF81191.1 holliday junction DNA helicase RuvA [Leadbettera azotonutricia ZAS-9]
MFNSLKGIITEKLSDSVYLLTGGVEWEISVPSTDIDRLPTRGEEGRVYTWLLHREDQMKLFGFADEERRATFLELLKVEGIGPKGALKIMGGIGQEELERALETENLSRLEAVPGLGKKTAQKMILALKGKLASARAAPEIASPYGELANALVEMGYDKKQAVDALAKADADLASSLTGKDKAEKEKLLFKQAIVYLSGM